METTHQRFARVAGFGLIVLVTALLVGTGFASHGLGGTTAAHAPVAVGGAPSTVRPVASTGPIHAEAAGAYAPHPSVGRTTTTTESPLPKTAVNSYNAVDQQTQTVYSVSVEERNWLGAATGNALTAYNLTTGASLETPMQLADPGSAAAISTVFAPIQSELFVAMINYGTNNYTNGYVLVVNTTTWSVVGNISSFPGVSNFTPYYMIYDPISQSVWVEDSYWLTVFVISPATNALTYYLYATCGVCYASGLIDVPSNDSIWIPTDTNAIGILNTSTYSWMTGFTWTANPSWYSDIGVEDTDYNWILITNDSATGDVNYFYPNGTHLYTTAAGGPTYPTAITFDPFFGLTEIADQNYSSTTSGQEIWEIYDTVGSVLDHYVNPNCTYYGGYTFDSLAVVDTGSAVYVVTGGEGNGSWLLEVNPTTGNLTRIMQYPSASYAFGYQVWIDSGIDRYFVYAWEQPALISFNLTTNALVWSLPIPTEYPPLVYFAFDTSAHLFYAADALSAVYIYSSVTGAYVGEVVTPVAVTQLAVDPIHHLVYAQDYLDNDTQVINSSTDTLLSPLIGPAYNCGVAAIPATGEAAVQSCTYVSNSTVTLYHGATAVQAAQLSIWSDGVVGQMTSDAAGDLFLPMANYDLITVYDAVTQTYVGNWTTGLLSPVGVAVDQADGVVLATGDFNNTGLDLLNLSTGAVTQTVALTSPADSIPAFDNLTNTFYSPMWFTGQMAYTTVVPLPSVPTGLGAQAGNGTVTLSWTAATGPAGYPVTGYQVIWATAASGPWTAGPTATTTAAVVTGLHDGSTYYFAVEAVGSSGTSAPSASANAIPLGVPYPPQSVTLGVDGSSILNVSWSAPSSSGGTTVANYTVKWASSASGPWTSVSAGTGTTHQLTGLTAATTYYVKVVAWNSAGQGNPSTTASATTKTANNGGGGGGGGNKANGTSSPLGLSGLDWIILIVVVVVIVAALAAVMMMRRRRGGASAAPQAPPPQWNPPPSSAPASPPPSAPANTPPGPPPGAQ